MKMCRTGTRAETPCANVEGVDVIESLTPLRHHTDLAQAPGVQQTVPAPDAPLSSARRVPWRTASVLGLIAFAISVAGSWIPSLWGDEAASIMSAQRPWASLFQMLGNVDAVHGTYYVFLHLWIDAFGASTFSVRLPSSIAVGVAAAGIVVLANRLSTMRVAVIAAVVFAVLPRVLYMGAGARSYAIGTALAVWLTIFFVHLISRGVKSRLTWLGYAAVFALSIYVFLYLILLVAVYAVTLLAYSRDHRLLLRWLAWSAVGVALASPLIYFASTQRKQVAFLGHRHGITLSSFIVTQWFGSDALALAAWLTILALVAASVVVLVRSRWRTRRAALATQNTGQAAPTPIASASATRPMIALRLIGDHAQPNLLVLAFAWFVLPPLALFMATTFIAPLYSVRYMSFVTPAVAILLALAIDAFARRRWIAVAVVAALIALAVPSDLAERGPYAKDGGSDWAQVAQVIGQNSHEGDAIAFDETIRPSLRPRLAMHVYPADFAKVIDVTLKSPYEDTSGLWDATQSIPASAARIAQTDGRLWLIEYHGLDGAGVVSTVGQTQRLAQLTALGYTVSRTFTLHRDAVYLLTKGS
jgi:mannosyltransferase